ncbi:aminotransferase class I/II-fold pyridoxal phosphate-dependent enzyme [Kitasatospora sp. GP82]|uniref:MalY/PatB family protein n=1 Tax=Kitasatospora sp. GP82 TaxID=3035089 RepID=UPI002476A641|nr:aminotransferase class I/II-fold pyridoxal phosphate-dependent enzyme [Kitasatospora sp. GP82]MDH6125355.1 cystathionine beta-lyase [Kitasatospora sp. GP82]
MERFDRSGTGSVKWARAGEGRIALGLADMDLPGPPEIGAALAERAGHSAYGYTACDPAGRELVAAWYRERHGVTVDPDWVLLLPFSPRTALRLLFTAAGPRRPVAFPAPEWGGFAQICDSAGLPYRAVPLARDATGYRLPVAALARGGADLIALSSPHNPSGRVWTAEEIRYLAQAVADSGGLLVSDEVHGDLVHPDHGLAQPVAAVVAEGASRHVVTLNSVGKTFNTSGVPSCFALVPDPGLRERLTTLMAGYGLWEGGLLEQVVQQAALRHGGPWLDALLGELVSARDLVLAALPDGAVLSRPEASYLLWLDSAALGLPADRAREVLLTERGVELSDGADFGPAGRGFLRLNYTLPRPLLRTALTRLTGSSCGE